MMQIFGVYSDGLGVLPASGGFKLSDFKPFAAISDAKLCSSGGNFKCCPSVHGPKVGIRPENHRIRSVIISALGNSGENSTPFVPLHFESSTGQFLLQILQTHPHLLPAAIDQQLERLQTDREAQKEETPPPSQDLLLYRLVIIIRLDIPHAFSDLVSLLNNRVRLETMYSSLFPETLLSYVQHPPAWQRNYPLCTSSL